MTAPDAALARSFVYRRLRSAGASFDDTGAASRFADTDDTVGRALGLADLSLAPRAGFKGPDAPAWLAAQGAAVADQNNVATAQPDGTRIARLAPGEALVLGGGAFIARLEATWADQQPPGCHLVPRGDSHVWFRITGSNAAAMFAKLCGVDLRPHRFAPLAIAQTSVARLSAIVIRDDIGEILGYHLLADSASAVYLWDCVLDAMMEFGGAPVGTEALIGLGDECLGGASDR